MTNTNENILTFSDTLFEQMSENGDSIAVFKIGERLIPTTLVLSDDKALERHRKAYPDTKFIGTATYDDIDRGYLASDLTQNNYKNYKDVSLYLEEQQAKSALLNKIPGTLGRLFGRNKDITQKPANTSTKIPTMDLK